MTNPISQAAVDAARQVLLDEGCLGQEHYPGYRDAVVTAALEAAMPELLDQIERLEGVIREQARVLDGRYARLAAVEKLYEQRCAQTVNDFTEAEELFLADLIKAVRGE